MRRKISHVETMWRPNITKWTLCILVSLLDLCLVSGQQIDCSSGFLCDFFSRFPHLPFAKLHPNNAGYIRTLDYMIQKDGQPNLASSSATAAPLKLDFLEAKPTPPIEYNNNNNFMNEIVNFRVKPQPESLRMMMPPTQKPVVVTMPTTSVSTTTYRRPTTLNPAYKSLPPASSRWPYSTSIKTPPPLNYYTRTRPHPHVHQLPQPYSRPQPTYQPTYSTAEPLYRESLSNTTLQGKTTAFTVSTAGPEYEETTFGAGNQETEEIMTGFMPEEEEMDLMKTLEEMLNYDAQADDGGSSDMVFESEKTQIDTPSDEDDALDMSEIAEELEALMERATTTTTEEPATTTINDALYMDQDEENESNEIRKRQIFGFKNSGARSYFRTDPSFFQEPKTTPTFPPPPMPTFFNFPAKDDNFFRTSNHFKFEPRRKLARKKVTTSTASTTTTTTSPQIKDRTLDYDDYYFDDHVKANVGFMNPDYVFKSPEDFSFKSRSFPADKMSIFSPKKMADNINLLPENSKSPDSTWKDRSDGPPGFKNLRDFGPKSFGQIQDAFEDIMNNFDAKKVVEPEKRPVRKAKLPTRTTYDAKYDPFRYQPMQTYSTRDPTHQIDFRGQPPTTTKTKLVTSNFLRYADPNTEYHFDQPKTTTPQTSFEKKRKAFPHFPVVSGPPLRRFPNLLPTAHTFEENLRTFDNDFESLSQFPRIEDFLKVGQQNTGLKDFDPTPHEQYVPREPAYRQPTTVLPPVKQSPGALVEIPAPEFKPSTTPKPYAAPNLVSVSDHIYFGKPSKTPFYFGDSMKDFTPDLDVFKLPNGLDKFKFEDEIIMGKPSTATENPTTTKHKVSKPKKPTIGPKIPKGIKLTKRPLVNMKRPALHLPKKLKKLPKFHFKRKKKQPPPKKKPTKPQKPPKIRLPPMPTLPSLLKGPSLVDKVVTGYKTMVQQISDNPVQELMDLAGLSNPDKISDKMDRTLTKKQGISDVDEPGTKEEEEIEEKPAEEKRTGRLSREEFKTAIKKLLESPTPTTNKLLVKAKRLSQLRKAKKINPHKGKGVEPMMAKPERPDPDTLTVKERLKRLLNGKVFGG